MKSFKWFIFYPIIYFILIFQYTVHLRNRPIDIKLGYLPDTEILKLTTGEFRYLTADLLIMKVLFYYGTLVDPSSPKTIQQRPDYRTMFKTIETIIQLDPYNMDAYYFSQAAFTWEVGHAADVNRLLDFGMKYRIWDYNLPFYAGFNEAYFLKNYATAAKYMKRASELTGNQLFIGLTGRYLFESGQTKLAIDFLESMIKGTKDIKLKRIYEFRRNALIAVEEINAGLEQFVHKNKKIPRDISQLVLEGILRRIPEDPYGGTFYIDDVGKVRSTSKFAFGHYPNQSGNRFDEIK